MTLTIGILGGFLGGCICTALFAHKIATALAEELHQLGNRLTKI